MPKLPLAIDTMIAWGFRYITCAFVWIKTNPKSGGIYSGLGYWTCGNAELCLLGKVGSPKRISSCVKQIVIAPRGRHSEKPDEVRNRIVQLIGDVPRIELFARKKTEGWNVWGLEVESDVDVSKALQIVPAIR
jgi:site-specific DNA-methyltransferase (adenine-specific)